MAGSLLSSAKPPLTLPSTPSNYSLTANALPLKPYTLSLSSPVYPKAFKFLSFNPSLHCRFKPCLSLESDVSVVTDQEPEKLLGCSKSFEEWDSLTAKFAAGANVPFLLLQMPQIILNARNLLAGNKSALFAVPWLAMLTGLLGNLSLLSYFVKKREMEAVLVQTLGAISSYVVIAQLAMAESMPLPHFTVTSVVVGSGLILNFLNYLNLLNSGIWQAWEDFVTIGGFAVLPQVMWSTFVPFIPNSILPGIVAFVTAVTAVVMVLGMHNSWLCWL
uniref:Maltose excess protein 1-like, chloroplastic n=1 Tax=Nelumbo nucifera TaxID=4432 RepID=A0A822YUQ3_NELNU|nr:TPA_asm: hypothetical protein HUJ06_007053 [Nelumbo nucifera]